MKYLFTKEGLKILESFCFTPTLFAFDYDGTLAKIVKTPSKAKMISKTQELLIQLDRLAPTAIISGRGITDLKALSPFQPKYLIGNHGLEGLKAHAGCLQTAQEVCHKWKKTLIPKINSEGGIALEDKNYSLAIHYRKSRTKSLAKLLILEACATLDPPPRIIMGKCVVNLIPSGAPHKGIALLQLMLECNVKTAFYIGDDDTDEDIFTLPDARLLSVRVGKKSATAAQFYVNTQGEVNRVIERIIGFLR